MSLLAGVSPAGADQAELLRRYFAAAKAAGCPLDQVYNFVRAGVVLFPKQLRASAAARLCDRMCPSCEARTAAGQDPDPECGECGPTAVGYGGARGGGKSLWLVAQLALDDCQRYPELKCLLLRKVGKSNRENFGDLKRKLIRQEAVPHTYREREGILEFARNGSRIITGHFKDEADIDSYLGLEYDIIGIEESTTLSKQKKDDVRGCLRSSKTAPFRWRPRVYETTNPGGISHASFKRTYILPMREGREADTRFIPATAHDNPALNPEYRTKVLGRYTGWQKQAWADGNWDIESGQYFANFRYETHVRPAAGFEVQRGWDVWGGLDHGLVHYTTFYLLCRDGDGHLYAVAEHAARGWLPSQHAEAIHDLLARRGLTIADIGPVLAGHDCFARRTTQDGEIGTVADDYAAAGIALERANISRLSGAKELYRRLGAEAQQGAAAVPATLTILDSCPRLFECIPSLQRDPRNPEDVLKVDCDDDGEGGDDPYDGFRYGYMKYAAMPRVSTAPTVVGPRRDFATLVVR